MISRLISCYSRYLYMLVVPLAYLPVLITGQHVDPDAKVILNNLLQAGSASGYLKSLQTISTVDFQPVRDLSLSVDLWFFHRHGLNTFIVQNLLWWLSSLFVLSKISEIRFSGIPQFTRSLIISCLGVYPLYTGVLSWGMNRKHLLALFFISLATYQMLKLIDRSTRGLSFSIFFSYFLSVLSQPIHLLWPFWAGVILFRNKLLRSNTILITSLGSGFIAVAAMNTFYYSHSATYKFHYTDKTTDLLNIPDKILALGHYFSQLFFPYFLSFKYDLSHWSVLSGIFLIPLMTAVLYKHKDRSQLFIWALLGILPILTVLNDPHIISDAYLLLPGFALVLCILQLIQSYRPEFKPHFLVIPLLAWSLISARESSKWNSRLELAKSSFESRPSCLSVVNYLKVGYDLYVRDQEALHYAEVNNCFKDMAVTDSFYFSMVVLFAHYYFHEETLPTDFRLERLRAMKQRHLYSHLSLIGLLIKLNRLVEARRELEELVGAWKNVNIEEEYHEITVRFIRPYCEREKLSGCLRITEKLVRKPNRPNL